jgi:polysaccharide export outer membrane protein
MTQVFNRCLFALALGLALALAACSSTPQTGAPDAAGAGANPALRAGDWIKVTVYGEASLSGDFQIDQSGSVLLPLAGPTKAAGMTPSELAQALTRRYRAEYVRDPKVTVTGPRGG